MKALTHEGKRDEINTRARTLLAAALIGALILTTIARATTTLKISTEANPPAAQTKKPNIVLVLMDNFGWGELGVYGGGLLRGAATPRIGKFTVWSNLRS